MKEITRTPQSRPAKKDRNLTRWLFVAPAMLVVLCLLVYPLCSTLLYSVTNKTLIKSTYAFKGIDNYIKIFTDPAFGKAFLTTLVWTFFSLTGQILIGFSAALALNRIRNPIARPIYRICMIIPWAFPSIAIALVWKWMLNGIQGYIPTMLMKLGLSDGMLQFLSDPKLVLPTLVFINIWFGAPMIMVNVYAALQTVPQDQYEAALIDGASSWQSFIHITVPHIKVVVGLLVVLRTIWVFNNFDIIFMTTAGGPASMTTTMPLYIYDLGWTNKLVGRASAASIILLAFLIAVCLMLFLNLEFGNNTYAIVEYGSAFHWPEHYVLIQGTKGAIRIDMCNVGMTVKLADGTEEHYCVHANKEIDDDRTRIYHSTEMDGAIQYGHPGKKPPMWLNSIMNAEMEFFNGVMHGDPIPDEFKPLMTGEAARAAIATADAATLSLRENRKVSVEEVMK